MYRYEKYRGRKTHRYLGWKPARASLPVPSAQWNLRPRAQETHRNKQAPLPPRSWHLLGELPRLKQFIRIKINSLRLPGLPQLCKARLGGDLRSLLSV